MALHEWSHREVAVKVFLRGLRHDADDQALVELLWDYTPSTIMAAEYLVGRLRTGEPLTTRVRPTDNTDIGWFVHCASEWGIEHVSFLMGAIDE